MKPYEKYKESGVEWIGEIPEHWTGTPLKHISSITKGKKAKEDFQDYSEGLIPYLSMEFLRNQTDSPIYVNPNDNSIVLVEEKDLLILWDGSKAGEIVKAKKGALSSTMGKIHINNVNFDVEFITYLLKYGERFIQSNRIGMGIPHVDGEVLRDLLILKPTLQEQTAIAKYLDHQTAMIDELIEKKTKQIALLKEKRQAIINETITKGVTSSGAEKPTAKMKDSGINWLGEIPESWKIVALRHLSTKIGSGVTPKGGADVYTEEGVIFVRSQNVHFDGLRLDDVVRIEPEIHDKMSGSKVMYKDVLLNITGASIGRCSVVNIEEEMNVNQHVCIIRPNNKISSEYLNLVLQSNIGQTQVKTGTTGGNREGLTFEAIKEFIIPVPEFTAQLAIVFKVEELLKQFQNLESQNINQIEKLKEYRQSLISEAVTGKIDVRAWGATTQPKA